MDKENYIEFNYNLDGHEEAMQSLLLLTYLLREKVSFTSAPIDKK